MSKTSWGASRCFIIILASPLKQEIINYPISTDSNITAIVSLIRAGWHNFFL